MATRYDNATKQTWRGWAWNQIAKRVPPGSTVMVLCGDGGFDLSVGIRKGYQVVGVDIDDKKVAGFRGSGGVAICDTVEQQILAMRPEGVIIDYMGGITQDRLNAVDNASKLCKGVVANFLRGRDPLGAAMCRDFATEEKHRGRSCMTCLTLRLFKHIWDTRDCLGDDDYLWLTDLMEAENRRYLDEFARNLEQSYSPEFYSYRSKDSLQIFDSVAMSWNPDWVSQVKVNQPAVVPRSKRKAAAAKAILTRRRMRN